MNLHTALRLQLVPGRPDVVALVGGGGKSSAVFRLALELAAAGRRAVITHTARIAAFQTAWSPAVVELLGDALPYVALEKALAAHGVCLLTGPVVGDRRAGLPPQLVDELAQVAPDFGLSAITVEADGSKMRPAKAPGGHEPVLPASTTLLAPILGLDAVGAAIDARTFHRDELVRQLLGLPETGAERLTPSQAARLLVSAAGGAKARPPAARLLPIFNKADDLLRLVYGRLAAQGLARQGQPALLAAVGRQADPVLERWGRVAVVILAAGAGSRLGRPKPLEVVDGQPMLLRALATAAILPGPVLVVTGAHEARVAALLADLPTALADALAGRLQTLHNPDWQSGQASSLHLSLQQMPGDVEAAIWMPVDQPYLEPRLPAQLAAAWRAGAQLAAPLADGEVRGAPALFDRSHWPDLLQVQGDRGGRSVLRRYAAAVAAIPAPAESLCDIDLPSDLT